MFDVSLLPHPASRAKSTTQITNKDESDYKAAVLAANPFDRNVDGAAQGFRDGFLEAGGADATISYISDRDGDGYNMPNEAYALCNRLYESGHTFFFVRQVDAKARTAQYLVDYQITAPWRYLHRAKLRFTLSRNGKVADRFENVIHFYQTRANYRSVRNADLWWPRDAGESALYEAKAEFVDEDGRVLATDVRKVGLRTIRLERENYLGDDHPGTFRFIVNGEPIYMHGCDITPMDAQHAHDREHVRKCCEMLVDLNCNMVRSWGGGVYEDDAFFDFCDAHGILVWQDFSMGNIQPVQRDDFAKAIEAEATKRDTA